MVTYVRNLMGRAFLDDGQAEEAARWFLRNFQADKQGMRAGDSLLFLAESMTKMGDTKRACIALAEFGETYPALATGRLQQQFDADRQKVKCNRLAARPAPARALSRRLRAAVARGPEIGSAHV